MATAAVGPMAAEEAEEALGLFTGIGLSEAKARETLRNGALSALLRQAVLQVRPPRPPPRSAPLVPRSPVRRHHPRDPTPSSELHPGPASPGPAQRPPPLALSSPPRPVPGPPVRRGSAPGRP